MAGYASLVSKSYIITTCEYNWLEEAKTTITNDVWLPDQVSSSLKTHQGSCQTIVDGLSTVTMWMESCVT